MVEKKAFSIHEDLLEKIENQAERENRNFSNMLRQCIRSYLNENGNLQDSESD